MIILTNSGTDKLQLTTDSTATVDVHASWVDSTGVSGSNVTPGNTGTAISTATTTDIVATPASSTYRNVKSLTVRNKHASTSVTATVILDKNGTDYELHKVVLAPGDLLEFIEGVGFFTITYTTKLDQKKYVTANSVHATAATFADVTGLTFDLKSGKNYCFECYLFHISNATTTGAQFGVNIGNAPTNLVVGNISTVTNSVTAAAFSAGVVTARDTAATAQTTGSSSNTITNLAGFITPSADGTFAIRATSEVTVAAGLTILKGSWCRIFEVDN